MGRKKKPGPKKANIPELRRTIKSQKEEIEKLKEELSFLKSNSGDLILEAIEIPEEGVKTLAGKIATMEAIQSTLEGKDVAISDGVLVKGPENEEIDKNIFTHEGIGVRLCNETGKYLLDTISYNPEHSNIKTIKLCDGGYVHAEFEIKKMLAHGKIVPN